MEPDFIQARKGTKPRLHVIEALMGVEAAKGKTENQTETARVTCPNRPRGVAKIAVPKTLVTQFLLYPAANLADLSKCF
jgi:hypothetical protein